MTWTGPSDATSWSGRTYNDGDDVHFLGDGTGTLTLSGTVNPASITVNAAGDYTFSGGVIAGTTDGLTKTNSGTLTLTGANTYTSDTTVDGGTFEIGGSGTVGDYTGDISIAPGAVFQYSSDQALSGANRFRGNITGGGTFTVDSSAGSVMFRQNTKSVSTIEVKAGTLEGQASNDALGTGATTIHLGDTSGTADAVLKLSGSARTFTAKAGLIVEGGSSGTKTISSSPGTFTDNTDITLEDHVTIANQGPLTLGGVLSDSGGSFGLTLDAQDATDTLTLSDQTDTSDYSGTTTIDNGTLMLSRGDNPATVPQGTITINNGGTMAFAQFNQLSRDGSIPDVVLNSGGVIDSSSTVTTFDSITLNGGTMQSKGGHSGAWGSFVILDSVTVTTDSLIEINTVDDGHNEITPGAFNGHRTLTFEVSGGATLTNELPIGDYNASRTYAIVKDGAGTAVFSGDNTFSSNMTVNAGTLAFGGAGSLGGGSYAGTISIAAGATLKYSSSDSQTFSALSTAGTLLVYTSSGTLNLDNSANKEVDILDMRNGTLNVDKLFYVNQFTMSGGAINHTTQRIRLRDGSGFANSSMSGGTANVTYVEFFEGSGVFDLDGGSLTFTGGDLLMNRSGSTGTFNLNGGSLALRGISDPNGTSTFNFDGGTLKPTQNDLDFLVVDTAKVLAGGAVIDTDGFDITIAQPLLDGGGGGGLTKNSTGTLTLSGANTYAGATAVNNGVLHLATGGSLSASTTVRISVTAEVDLDGGISQTVQALWRNGLQTWAGTWGATGSGADNIDDDRFSGTGVLVVSTGVSFPTLFRFQ